MIREKNYSLIKAIRDSSCCSKSDGGGGETTFDDVVKYYTGYTTDEILDWKVLQGAKPDTLPPSFPLVKVEDDESDSFSEFIESHSSQLDIQRMSEKVPLGQLPTHDGITIYELKISESPFGISPS